MFSRIILGLLVLPFTLMAAPDFELRCHDGSHHWKTFTVEVNYPVSKIQFSGDGVGSVPTLQAMTRVASEAVEVEGKKETAWTYTFRTFRPEVGGVEFTGLDVGDHEVGDGDAQVNLTERFEHLNGEYTCQVIR